MTDRTPPNSRLIVGVLEGQSDDVVQQAIRFAQRLQAELILATVDETRYSVGKNPDGTTSAFPIDPDQAEIVIEAFSQDFKAHLTSLLEPSGVSFSFRALAGEPAHELARVAHEIDADAIIVGTRKPGLRTTAHEFFNGSVAVHLAHRQHHPVIVIPINPVSHGERLPWEEA